MNEGERPAQKDQCLTSEKVSQNIFNVVYVFFLNKLRNFKKIYICCIKKLNIFMEHVVQEQIFVYLFSLFFIFVYKTQQIS